jgi:uncharacterized protein YidB (DUF937 family)
MSAPRPSVFDALATDPRAADVLDQRLLADFADRMAAKSSANSLQMLLDDVRAAGFDADVRAWLAPGQSTSPPPLPPEAIIGVARQGQVIDGAWLAQEAQSIGVDVDLIARRLAALVPGVVKALTPRGDVPTARALLIGLDGLRRKAVR